MDFLSFTYSFYKNLSTTCFLSFLCDWHPLVTRHLEFYFLFFFFSFFFFVCLFFDDSFSLTAFLVGVFERWVGWLLTSPHSTFLLVCVVYSGVQDFRMGGSGKSVRWDYSSFLLLQNGLLPWIAEPRLAPDSQGGNSLLLKSRPSML